MRMSWEKLLTGERFFWPRSLEENEQPSKDDALDVFQVDLSRITLSPPFHRLQRKTQVLPFPKLDYPRTRLTHTNEVTECGRQIARLVSQELCISGDLSPSQAIALEDIVAAACKAHDIGNPPFGHSGEHAIHRWVLKKRHEDFHAIKTENYISKCGSQFIEEMASFDGNAQGFRIITETAGWRRKGGLQLTCAVLGAFSKYPWTHDRAKSAANAVRVPNHGPELSSRKYGVFHASSDLAAHAFHACGMIDRHVSDDSIEFSRHPLAYIVEAADDISYMTADLEDAFRSGVVTYDDVVKRFFDVCKVMIDDADRQNFSRRIMQASDGTKSGYLRYLKDHAQRALKILTAKAFLANYDKIMTGDFSDSLLNVTIASQQCKEVKYFMKSKVYDNEGKVRNEIFGSAVVTGLLDYFFEILFVAKLDFEKYGTTNEALRKMLIIFPFDNYCSDEKIQELGFGEILKSTPNEEIAMMIVDYVSGMTDSYATDVFQQVHGMQRPSVNW